MVRGASAPLTLFREYPGRVLELLGDSARGDDWAVARLRVDGDRIVDADVEGLDADLKGLTLLEAAAVGGETLPVDALANALGPAVTARATVASRGGRDERRRRQRGVAAARRPDAVGVTLRLWLDPAGPDSDRACCSPSAVIAARETCHAARAAARHARPARAVPPCGRDAVRPRLRARRDTESVHPLQRRLPLRRAARISPPRRRRTPVDRPLRADRRARRPASARARGRPAQGPELHARAARPAPPASHLVPARRPGEVRDTRGGGARRPRGRPARREPGGVLPRRGRLPLVPGAAGLAPHGGSDRRRGRAARSARTTGSGGSRPASAAASASRPRRRSTRCAPIPARTPSSPGRGRRSHARASRRGVASTARLPASRPSSATARPRSAPRSRRRPRVSGSRSTSPPTAWPVDRPPCSTTETSSSVPGWSRRPGLTRLASPCLPFPTETSPIWRSRSS